jgi:NifU-like protein involved in Fe-S cluster formation
MTDFSQKMMDHFQDPFNRYSMTSPAPDLVGKGSLDGHPPYLTLYLRLEGKMIGEAAFEAAGCGVTIACGSMLTALVKGCDHAACCKITAHQLSEALDGVPSGKEYCAEVAISALRDAIRSWH